MRTATTGVILAAETILGWSVGLRGAAFFAFFALWGIIVLLCGLRGAWHHTAPLADDPSHDPADDPGQGPGHELGDGPGSVERVPSGLV